MATDPTEKLHEEIETNKSLSLDWDVTAVSQISPSSQCLSLNLVPRKKQHYMASMSSSSWVHRHHWLVGFALYNLNAGLLFCGVIMMMIFAGIVHMTIHTHTYISYICTHTHTQIHCYGLSGTATWKEHYARVKSERSTQPPSVDRLSNSHQSTLCPVFFWPNNIPQHTVSSTNK